MILHVDKGHTKVCEMNDRSPTMRSKGAAAAGPPASVNASAVYGGAIYTSGNSTVANYPVLSVVNSFFDSNSAFRGGAIAFYYSSES